MTKFGWNADMGSLKSLTGCGTNKKDTNGRGQNALEQYDAAKASESVCPDQEYSELPSVTYNAAMCYLNGSAYTPDDKTMPAFDSCNAAGCWLYADGIARIATTNVGCAEAKQSCTYGIWIFSHCFRFKDSNGQLCSCNNGKIQC